MMKNLIHESSKNLIKILEVYPSIEANEPVLPTAETFHKNNY